MPSIFDNLFDDELIIKRVKNKLPYLFQIAEVESSRNGKIGMEVGSIRERILIALLIYKFGIDIVDPDIPITFPEVDVYVNKIPLSIKTLSVKNDTWHNVKVIWTVDQQKALEFKKKYTPSCDMLIAKICWNGYGKLLLFSKETQIQTLSEIGRDKYIDLPKVGTNSRGVEITKEALTLMEHSPDTRKIDIKFSRRKIDSKEIYKKWLDAWGDAN